MISASLIAALHFFPIHMTKILKIRGAVNMAPIAVTNA